MSSGCNFITAGKREQKTRLRNYTPLFFSVCWYKAINQNCFSLSRVLLLHGADALLLTFAELGRMAETQTLNFGPEW